MDLTLPSVKTRVARAVAALPDDVSFEDVIERVVFLHRIEQGLRDSHAGRTVPQADVEADARAWRP